MTVEFKKAPKGLVTTEFGRIAKEKFRNTRKYCISLIREINTILKKPWVSFGDWGGLFPPRPEYYLILSKTLPEGWEQDPLSLTDHKASHWSTVRGPAAILFGAEMCAPGH